MNKTSAGFTEHIPTTHTRPALEWPLPGTSSVFTGRFLNRYKMSAQGAKFHFLHLWLGKELYAFQ